MGTTENICASLRTRKFWAFVVVFSKSLTSMVLLQGLHFTTSTWKYFTKYSDGLSWATSLSGLNLFQPQSTASVSLPTPYPPPQVDAFPPLNASFLFTSACHNPFFVLLSQVSNNL